MQTTTLPMETRQCKLRNETSKCNGIGHFKVLTTSKQEYCCGFCDPRKVDMPTDHLGKPSRGRRRGRKRQATEALLQVPDRVKKLRALSKAAMKADISGGNGEAIRKQMLEENEEKLDEAVDKHVDKEVDKHLPSEEEIMVQRWEGYVHRARMIVRSLNTQRLEIAELALAACDIQHGGGNHWKKFAGVHTLKKFAEDVGISYKTLANWCSIKRNVKDKLPEGEWSDRDWNAANRTNEKLATKGTPAQVLKTYRSFKKKCEPVYHVAAITRKVSTYAYALEQRIDLRKVTDEQREQLKSACRRILKLLG